MFTGDMVVNTDFRAAKAGKEAFRLVRVSAVCSLCISRPGGISGCNAQQNCTQGIPARLLSPPIGLTERPFLLPARHAQYFGERKEEMLSHI